MKRGASVVLIGLGVFLLVLAPAVRFWAAPRLVTAPSDINAVLHAGGDNFNYLNGQTGQNERITVSVTRHIIGDVSSSNADVAVYQESLCLTRDDNKQGLGCVRADDPRLITNTSDRVAFDRVSGEAVTGNVCGPGGNKNCNASVNGDPNVKHVGLDYKFPIDTEKQTYQFFDTVVGKAFPAVYKGTEKKGGLDCYKFVQTIPESPVLTNGVLPSTYSNTRTVWVEPTTGVIVDGSEDLTQVLTGRSGLNAGDPVRDPELVGKVALQGLLRFTDATIKSQAKLATDNLPKIHAVRLYLPIGALVLGLICLVLGVVFSRRTGAGARRAPEGSPAGNDHQLV